MALGLVAAGCDDGTVSAISITGKFDPGSLDFGDVPVNMTRTLTTTLKNTSAIKVTIDDVEVPRSFTLPGLKTSLVGHELAPGGEMELEVGFIAMTEGEATGDLVVTFGTTKVTLKLRGNAVKIDLPVLSIAPESLDFGEVEINTEQRRSATLTNMGTANGTIERVDSSNGEFRLEGAPVFDIPVGGSYQATIVFRPTSEGAKSGTMTFVPAGGYAPLTLNLSGSGKIPLGEILCSPTTLDFGRVERGQSNTRQVTCSARGGAARLISASLGGGDPYFSILNPPTTADLTDGQSVTIDVTYTPDGLPMPHGNEMRVSFAGGAGGGTALVTLTGEVIPPPPTATAISIVSRWNSNGTDVDLHLVRPNGTEFDTSDCYYANPSPDWGVQNDMSDNPYLDVDDVDGFGPETINLSQTANGQYRVMLHYFSDHFNGPTQATVEVYVAGVLQGTYNRNLDCDDIWTVGTVTWNGTTGTFAPSNMVRANTNRGACL